MSSINKNAYNVLTKDEQLSLTLSIIQDKSSWKAGEIMQKAHYKYLEIQKRAKHFLKIFTEYLEITDNSIVPHKSVCDLEFQAFVQMVVFKRMTIAQMVEKTVDARLADTKSRHSLIIENMRRLERSNVPGDREFAGIVKSFDAWNNFRILPPDIQEPSAYKRRNKHKSKKLIKLAYSLSPVRINGIRQMYEAGTNLLPENTLYLPLVITKLKKDILIIKVHKKHLKNISELSLYIFEDINQAEIFIKNIIEYMTKEKKHCKDGQKFWPLFRTHSSKAANFDYIQNINPNRKTLEMAERVLDKKTNAERGLHL